MLRISYLTIFLILNENIVKALNSKEPLSPLNDALLRQAMAYVKQSRSKMSRCYSDWDMQGQVYRGEREPDDDDLDQEDKGKPVKMIVPNTFAQVQTFVSFLFLMFKQNRTFFELTGLGDEDKGSKARDSELILEHDLRKSQFNTVLFQHLTDIGVRGPGILACEWVRRTAKLRVTPAAVMTNIMGVDVESRPGSEWKDYVKFEGNEVRPVSPYRFFPDTAFPLTEALRRGRFCAYEEEYTMSELRDMQRDGTIAGVENIQPFAEGWSNERGGITRTVADFSRSIGSSGESCCGHAGREGPVLVTKMKMWLIPSKFEYENDKKLGPEEFPVLYHVWYANDNTLLRAEPAEEWHNSFGMTLSQFTPDMHQTVSKGLADLVYRLQDQINFAFNTHNVSIRRVIQNRMVINPDVVETKKYDGEGDIYLKKGFGRRPVTDAISQLAVQDVTSGFMSDIQMMGSILQMVTGVNENLQGQYNGGRRSAQESRTVTAGAAGRMKLHGHLIWDSGLGPLAEIMLSNSRQSISTETFSRIIGEAAKLDPQRYLAYKGTPEEVIAQDDYFTFDSTLSSEKGFAAQSVQELIGMILSANPQAAFQLAQSLDITKMVDEMQYLRNGTTTARFRYAPGTQPPSMMPQMLPEPTNAAS